MSLRRAGIGANSRLASRYVRCGSVFYRIQLTVVEVRQTETYAQWFARLRDRQARARIDVRIRRLSLGNPGDVRPVGEGVSEL